MTGKKRENKVKQWKGEEWKSGWYTNTGIKIKKLVKRREIRRKNKKMKTENKKLVKRALW